MRVASVHTYPIKGCHGLDHDDAGVEPWGLAGDRRWMVVDEDGLGVTQREATELVTVRPEVRPGGLVLRAAGRADLDLVEPADAPPVPVRVFASRLAVPARPAGALADDWLTELLGRKARLVWLAHPARHVVADGRAHDPGDQVSFADVFPLLLTARASLDALNGWLLESGDEPLPMTRFRPNLVVAGAEPWAEDGWEGRRVRIGSTMFRAAGPCDRCVVTTTDQETGTRGKEPLRVLAAHRRIDQKLLFGLHLVPEDTGGRVAVGDPVEPLP